MVTENVAKLIGSKWQSVVDRNGRLAIDSSIIVISKRLSNEANGIIVRTLILPVYNSVTI